MNVLKRLLGIEERPLSTKYYVKLRKGKGGAVHWDIWHINRNVICSSSSRESTRETAINFAREAGLEVREADE